MINAGSLIGALMEGGLNSGAGARLQNAMGPKGLGQPGVADLLGNLLGAGQSGGGLGGMLGSVLGGGKSAGLGNAAIGGVLGSIFGGGGGVGGVAKGGAMAVLGMLAVNALKGYMADKSGDPGQQANMQLMAGLREPESETEQQQVQDLAMLIVRAMVNAAKADGQVDRDELDKILGRLQKSGADAADMDFVRQELSAPMDTDAIIAAVTDPQVAAQVYAASLLAISVDTDAERIYIDRLGEGLGLPMEARNQIHSSLGI